MTSEKYEDEKDVKTVKVRIEGGERRGGRRRRGGGEKARWQG